MSEDSNKAYKWIVGKVQSRDLFGIPISLTYKGDTEFKTCIGGCTSIFVTSIILYYAALLLKILINREESNVSVNTIQTDLTYNPVSYNIGRAGFTFGVALVHNNGSDLMNDESLLTMDIEQVTWVGAEIGDNHTAFANKINHSVCDVSDFSNLNSRTLDSLNVFSEYYCPDQHDYNISGNLISTLYNYVRVKIKKCMNESYCQSEADINNTLQGVELKLAISNSYFDIKDYNEPIKHFYDDELRWKLMPGFKISKYVSLPSIFHTFKYFHIQNYGNTNS